MSYVNNQLIECMRATSTEKTSLNNSNVAKFTNKLNQALVLNVGDQVSIERSFINGLGAGNQDTIQFSGKKIKPHKAKTQKYTKITGSYYQNKTFVSPYRMGYYLKYDVEEEETEPLEIKDNEASVIVGYYINSSNHPSYLQLPRRFASRYYNQSTSRGDWTESDTEESGLPLIGNSVEMSAYCYADWRLYQVGDHTYIKQRVDNSRFTLYLRKQVYYAKEMTNNLSNPPPPIPLIGARPQSLIPEYSSYAQYLRYRERKIINVDTGFSTPQNVAEQIKEQLNQSEEAETFEIGDNIDNKIKHTLTTTMKAETYKPFNVANVSEFSENGWDDYSRFLDPNVPMSNRILQYDASFYAVGVKRPEIWDAGRDFAGGKDNFTNSFNSIYKTIDINNRVNIDIYFEHEWNDAFLIYWKNLFEAQKLYPELWDDLDKLPAFYEFSAHEISVLTPERSAILHMATFGQADSIQDQPKVPHPINQWGEDGLRRTASSRATTGITATAPLFVRYDGSQKDYYVDKDLFTPDIEELWDDNKLVYGFAKPWYRNGRYYIRFTLKGVAKIPSYYFTGTTPAEGGNPAIPQSKIWGSEDLYLPNSGREIGYDWSWTAYGTACILPYSPQHEKSYEGQGITHGQSHWVEAVQNSTKQGIIPTIIYSTQSYLGANNPLLNYNTETNRFEFSQLHTAENLGNSWDAGDMNSGDLVAPPINPSAGDIVYKINPRIGYDGYSPTFKPYSVDARIQFADPDGANTLPDMIDWENDATHPTQDQLKLGRELNQRDISLSNENIEAYKIFDAWGGIYFDDMGYNEEEWEQNSLWGRLGFSWEQFNSQPSTDNLLDVRVSERNRYHLYRPTTNSIVDTTDTKAFYVNLYGAPLYSTAIGTAKIIQKQRWIVPANGPVYPNCSFTPNGFLQYYPALTQKTSSISIPARNLPKVQLNPFYTIRSNIIGYTDYLGSGEGGMRLNVVGIVDRYGAQGDFFYGSPSDITFTITKQTIISDIETEICNPDGSLADVNADCGVIYKVQRTMPPPQNIIEQILEQTQKK